MKDMDAINRIGSESIFERIKAQANSRTLRCLMNLKSACDLLNNERLEITAARVGGFTAKMQGGPKEQSIRNSKDFAAYVHARKSEQGILESHAPFASGGIRTGDNRIDAYIRTLELEVEAGRQHLANLKKAFTKNCTFDYAAAMKGELVIANGNGSDGTSEPEKAELRRLFDPTHLASVGLEFSAGGQLRNAETLRTVIGPDAIRVIRQICGAQGVGGTEAK